MLLFFLDMSKLGLLEGGVGNGEKGEGGSTEVFVLEVAAGFGFGAGDG